MRVQSETLKLERGAPTERCRLHENWHRAVWCEEVEDKSTVLFVNCLDGKTDPVVACCGEHVLVIWVIQDAVRYTWYNVS